MTSVQTTGVQFYVSFLRITQFIDDSSVGLDSKKSKQQQISYGVVCPSTKVYTQRQNTVNCFIRLTDVMKGKLCLQKGLPSA